MTTTDMNEPTNDETPKDDPAPAIKFDTQMLVNAYQEAERLLTMMQGVETVVDAMRKVGSLAQAGNEAKGRLSAINAQIEQAQVALNAKLAEIDVAIDAHVKQEQEAKDRYNARVVELGELEQSFIDVKARTELANDNRIKAENALAEARAKLGV